MNEAALISIFLVSNIPLYMDCDASDRLSPVIWKVSGVTSLVSSFSSLRAFITRLFLIVPITVRLFRTRRFVAIV